MNRIPWDRIRPHDSAASEIGARRYPRRRNSESDESSDDSDESATPAPLSRRQLRQMLLHDRNPGLLPNRTTFGRRPHKSKENSRVFRSKF